MKNQCFAESVIDALTSVGGVKRFLGVISGVDKVARLLLSDFPMHEITSLVVTESRFEYDVDRGHDSYEFLVFLLNRFYESAVSLKEENRFVETFVTIHCKMEHLILTVDLPLLDHQGTNSLGKVVILLLEGESPEMDIPQMDIPPIKDTEFIGAIMFDRNHFYFTQTLHQTLHTPRLAFYERVDLHPL